MGSGKKSECDVQKIHHQQPSAIAAECPVTVLDIENAHFLHGFPLRRQFSIGSRHGAQLLERPIVNQSQTGAIVWNKS
jgi:hypothetical protein